MRLQLFGSTSVAESVDISNQRTINLYYDTPDVSGARSPAYLVHTPGFKSVLQIADQEVRGQLTIDNRHFAVIGNSFYELTYNSSTDSMSSTFRGTLTTNTGPVSMAYNLSQIIIVDGTVNARIFNYSTNTWANLSDPDFRAADIVVFMDTYFIFHEVGTARIFASGINEANAFDPLDIATAEKLPDLVTGLEVVNNELWVFGSKSLEIWVNTAEESGFPFTPRANAAISVGCLTQNSIAKYRDYVLWLSDNREIMFSTGYGDLTTVSTRDQHRVLQNYANVSDVKAFTYNEDGHWFYVISFPTANITWAYDIDLKMWHERTYTNSITREVSRSRIQNMVYSNGYLFGGDHTNGKIYRIGRDLYDDDGEVKYRTRITGNLNVENRLMSITKLSISISTGVGTPAQYPATTTTSDDDPKLILQWSHDNGRTWSNELWRPVGAYNEFYSSCDFYRLGTNRNWTFKLQYIAKTPIALIDCFAEIDLESGYEPTSAIRGN